MVLSLLHHLASTTISPGNLPTNVSPDHDEIIKIINIFLNSLGGFALLVIIIAGFRYITAAGDEGKIAQARGAITYALVGLVVALFAEAIVLFVGKQL